MESRDIATNQIQIQKDRKKNVYQEVIVKVSDRNVYADFFTQIN